jgi:regulator of replication initiation timing
LPFATIEDAMSTVNELVQEANKLKEENKKLRELLAKQEKAEKIQREEAVIPTNSMSLQFD